MPGLAGFSVPTSAARQKMRRFAVVPLQSTPFQHADERNQEGRRDNKAPASSPFALPVYALIYLLISGGADTGVIPSTSAYFISSPRDRSNSLCRRKKKGERYRSDFDFHSRHERFSVSSFWEPLLLFFFFFPRLNSSCPQLCCRTCCRYLVAEGGPGIIRLVLPSSFSACLPLRHALSPSSESRELLLLFFFSLRIIRSSRGDGFRARGRHGYREQRTARSHSRP